ADLKAAHGAALCKERRRIDGRFACEVADHTDMAIVSKSSYRLLQCSGAADVDDEIRTATAGEVAHALIPVRRRPVVDDVTYAEFAQALDLPFAAGRSDDLSACHQSKLRSEDRYAAGAERHDGVTRLQLPFDQRCVPRRDSSARQRR